MAEILIIMYCSQNFYETTSFKVADTAFAISKNLGLIPGIFLQDFLIISGCCLLRIKRKMANIILVIGRDIRFGLNDRNHFNGNVYVLTNGLTFSASSLFCNAVKGSKILRWWAKKRAVDGMAIPEL